MYRWERAVCARHAHGSAHKALSLGLIGQLVPVLKVDGEWIPNPMVIHDRITDTFGNIVFGDFKQGAEREAAKEVLAKSTVDLAALDTAVDQLCTKILMLMP